MATRVRRFGKHLVKPCGTAGVGPVLTEGSHVAVTGAAGYVGGWLVTYLLQKGYGVRACVRDTSNDRKTAFLKAMPDYRADGTGKLTLHSADMTKPGVYDDIFAGCTVVFHPAEVMMSFGFGRDPAAAAKDFGRKIGRGTIPDAALESSQYVVDSVNKSGTVRALVYTSSIMAMMDGSAAFYEANPVIDESRHPTDGPSGYRPNGGYNTLKDATEAFFFAAASESVRAGGRAGGGWACISANPADIIGPILSAHQAGETWQGKVGGILAGVAPPQETSTLGIPRPWITVDVRDVARAEVALAEALGDGARPHARTCERYLLTDMTRIHPEHIGARLNALFAERRFDCATELAEDGAEEEEGEGGGGGSGGGLEPMHPVWDRVQARNDKLLRALSPVERVAAGSKLPRHLQGQASGAPAFAFTKFDDTLRDTAEALIAVGGVQPRLK